MFGGINQTVNGGYTRQGERLGVVTVDFYWVTFITSRKVSA